MRQRVGLRPARAEVVFIGGKQWGWCYQSCALTTRGQVEGAGTRRSPYLTLHPGSSIFLCPGNLPSNPALTRLPAECYGLALKSELEFSMPSLPILP